MSLDEYMDWLSKEEPTIYDNVENVMTLSEFINSDDIWYWITVGSYSTLSNDLADVEDFTEDNIVTVKRVTEEDFF
ncbi:hypothetical protein DIS13_09290 [Weissella paramesenteroides]|uniref:Uncharacterized protein n=1 Tax=Weissella paramesenteroides ATCC 33313 TaxID=585506 RepID=C5R857_WEIPA|nr:hypothetical protein [Weissella paramesenteroides]EER75641.1 hypothetical protein HMPREF0877_0152 [Weissella paramesenteroides ATCC 33313]TOY71528.1 hypothetical protein DIS13_09290 [Weissella paramesenteroides]